MGLISRVSSRTYRNFKFLLNPFQNGFHQIRRNRSSGLRSFQKTIFTIVDVIDKNHVIIDSPAKDSRAKINMNNIQLTKFKLEFLFGAKTSTVKKVWEAAGLSEKWAATQWAKNIEKKAKRANLGDFDRFKVMKLKQQRRHIINNTKA